MEEKKMLYAVTSGSYSDYTILGLFSDKAKAKEFSEFYNKTANCWEYAGIEEYVDGELLTRDGYLWQVFFSTYFGNVKLEDASVCTSPLREELLMKNNGIVAETNWIRVYVRARDEEHAKKIAADKLAEYLAKEQGV